MTTEATCAWCAAPATTDVEIEPAKVGRDRTGAPTEIRPARTMPACDAHAEVRRGPSATKLVRRKARGSEQASILDAADDGPGNAIYGGDAA